MNIGVWIPLAALCMLRVSECLECFSCQNIADPDECRNTSQCSSGQSCSLQTIQAGSDLLFNMGCQNNQLCSTLPVGQHSFIGRSSQTRQTYTCHECCSVDRCNQNLCSHRKPSDCTDDETLDCARLNTLFNVCADVHHAKITCPKFCGLCQLVDGNWAAWENWSSCSVTCEDGKQTRTRTCTNPPPSNGGLNCTGPAVDTKLCTKQLCPVHGNWTDWSTWSGCSVTCDVGLAKRTRTCTNPKPDRSGDYCVGEPSEYTVCQHGPCVNPVNGNWSAWSVWSDCSVTCDGGLKKRSRTCSNPKPNILGDYCTGDPMEYQSCLNDPCGTSDGGWSSWGSWQSCSVTCGTGLNVKERTCTNPSPTLYGKACEGNSETFAVCLNTPCNVVAFNAYGYHLLSNLVNAFSTVIFNEGNAYNANTGHFTAPVDGLYFFTTQICGLTGQNHYFFMEKGWRGMIGVTQLTATLINNQSGDSCTSASSYVKLSGLQHVWVMMDSSFTTASDINVRITFSGTLIQEF